MLLMQQMYDWDSFLFLASQVYNARNGMSISALARQVSTKNELGKPHTQPIENERGAIHFETASREWKSTEKMEVFADATFKFDNRNCRIEFLWNLLKKGWFYRKLIARNTYHQHKPKKWDVSHIFSPHPIRKR